MSRRLLSLLLFACFVFLPLLLFERDRRESLEIEQNAVLRELGKTGELDLDQANRAGSCEAQVRNRILDLKQQLVGALPTADALGLFWKHRLRPLLPPHELVIIRLDGKKPQLLFHAGLPLGMASSPFPMAFAEALAGPQPPSEKTIQSCSAAFPPLFHFPPHPAGLFSTWKGGLEIYQARRQTYGSFWDESRLAGGGRCLILASFRIDPLDRFYPFRTMAAAWHQRERGIACIGNSPDQIYVSAMIRRSPMLVRILRDAASGKRRLLPRQQVGRYLLQSGERIPGTTWKPIIVSRIPAVDREIPWQRAVRQTALGLILAAAFFLMIESSWFARGWRLPLAAALLGMFLLVALLPISGASTITRRALAEQSQIARETMASQVHRELLQIDADARFEWLRTASSMKRFSSHPAVVKELLDLERRRNIDQRTWRDPGDLPKRMQELAQQDLHRRFNLPPCKPDYSPALFIAFFGRDSFRSTWSQLMESQKLTPDAPAIQVALDFLKLLGTKFMEQIELQSRETASLSRKQSLILELTYDSLVSVGGLETILNVRHFPHQVNFFSSHIERMGLQQVPLVTKDGLSFLCIWFWTQLEVNRAYLRGLLSRQAAPPAEHLDERVFAMLGQGRGRVESFPSDMENQAPLRELMERAEAAGEPVRASIPSPDDPAKNIGIREALPSHAMCSVYLGTQRSTRPIDMAENERRTRARVGMLIALLFALLVAFAGVRHVLVPIRRLQTAVEAIAADRYEIRLEIDREDEFASLFRAFNGMARGLQEGQFLGRYVSSSVRRALTDSSFSEAAVAGEIREVTILFSSLSSFWETAAGRPPGEVFPFLERHLQAMDRAVTAHGGEIDKVIGEKILVVFDHQFLGGAELAATAAIEVVRQVRRELATALPSSLQPVMGLNSGPVIAGMLGAATVRLDYTVIGDPVNLAARLATLSSGLILADPGFSGVLLSGRVLAMLGGQIQAKRLPIKQVKGKTQEVEVFTMLEPPTASGASEPHLS